MTLNIFVMDNWWAPEFPIELNLEVLVCVEEKRERGENPLSKDKNQHQTQAAYDDGSWN